MLKLWFHSDTLPMKMFGEASILQEIVGRTVQKQASNQASQITLALWGFVCQTSHAACRGAPPLHPCVRIAQ